jgi:UDP-N-acetylmuramate dehydrogenase
LKDISLRSFNTFGLEAAARYYTRFTDAEEAAVALSASETRDLPLLVLGGGRNILFTRDFEGLVLHNAVSGMALVEEDSRHWYVKCGAGESWHTLVTWCISKGYAGLENLSLIPGTAGAGPLQNIGAYGVEFKDHFHELEALEIATGKIVKFDSFACRFGYRESVFKQELKGRYIVLNVIMRLDKYPVFHIEYGAIKTELERMKVTQPTANTVSEAVCAIRRSKLPDPAVLGNAGSFFKNPEVSKMTYDTLMRTHPGVVAFELPNGNYKIAAGWLIEQCGWRGKRVGNTGSHKDQALVLVNYGGATGAEIYDLAMQIRESVLSRFGVEINPEVNII